MEKEDEGLNGIDISRVSRKIYARTQETNTAIGASTDFSPCAD